mgnify:CR=1 FL=1
MGKLDPLLPCPHCGNAMRAGSLKRHEPLCVKNPATFARYHDVLTAAPGSNRGITCGRYVELSTADKSLPMVITLRRLTGKKNWDDVLAVFGLRPPLKEQQRSQCPHCGKFISGDKMAGHLQECRRERAASDAAKIAAAAAPKPERKPRKPMNVLVPRKPRATPPKTTCPQCNMQRIDMRRHVCPEDPAVVAWLARVLPDPDDPTRIITCQKYRELPDKAIAQNVIDKAYGSWRGLAARYGLEVRRQRRDTDGPPKLDAASLAELHRLADELHGGEYGPSHGEYTLYAADTAMGTAGLKKTFGTWAAVLAAADLRHGSHGYYMRASNTRRKAHEAARGPRGPVPSKYERDDEPVSRSGVGLPVASVQKPVVISRPDDVYKGYVRTMIR